MTTTIHALGPGNPVGPRGRASRRSVIGAAALSALGIASFAGPPRGAAAAQATPGARDEQAAPVGVRREPDHAGVPYVDDGDPLHTLDIYLPARGMPRPAPVVVWIHGGGYVGGGKERVGIPYLIDDGYAIVSIDYRLLQDAPFPAQIVDANAAISWVWRHAGDYGFDRDRLVVGGASAGGTSSVLVAVGQNDAVPEFAADPDVRIAALLDFFGSTTEEQAEPGHNRRRDALLGVADERALDLLNAIQYVDADDPPALVVHGDLDETVAIEQSEALVAALEAAGVPVTFARYAELGHGPRKFQFEEIRETVRTFLAEALA